MTLHYIDPTVSSGGSGTLANPYALADGLAAFNALSGSLGGDSWLFKSGTFGRLTAELGAGGTHSNFTLGYYGTGAKPIIAFSAIKTGTWTQVDSNTWSIAHTPGFDTFCYGGQAANGLITISGNPYGTALTPVDTLAHCQATTFSNFWTANTMYVNLGGQNPNNLVMEYGALKFGFHLEAGAANLTIDSIRFANAWDANIYHIYVAGSANPVFKHVETDQGGSVRGLTVKGNMQIIGSGVATRTYTSGLIIDDLLSTNSFFSGLDLLHFSAPLVHKLKIDACNLGLGLWDDVIDGTFTEGKITNIVPSPYYDSLSGVQIQHQGIIIWGTGQGNNGFSWNNHFSGYVIANCQHNPLYILGGQHVFENCTFYGTSNQLTTTPYNSVVNITAGAGQTDKIDLTFSNNLVIFDQPNYFHFPFWQDATANNYLHGDKNVYLSTGGSDATHWRSVTNGAVTNTTFAAWQTAIGTQMDANSVFIANDSAAPSIVNYGSLSTVRNASYLSGFDVTPRNKLDGYAADSQMVGFGNVLYTTISTAPAALTTTALASGTSTWPTATYHMRATYVTVNGETTASADATVAITISTNKPQITNLNAPAAQTGAVGWNIYVGTTAGNATKQNAIPIVIGTGWTSPDSGMVTGVSLPQQGPITVSPEDANGNPCEPNNMVCGGVQNLGGCAPSRQKRASGGW